MVAIIIRNACRTLNGQHISTFSNYYAIYLLTHTCALPNAQAHFYEFFLVTFRFGNSRVLFILIILDSCILCIDFVVTIAAATNYFHYLPFLASEHFRSTIKTDPVEDIGTASICGTVRFNFSGSNFPYFWSRLPVLNSVNRRKY